MSRTRRAITGAGFTYLQFGLGIVTGIVLVPLIIRSLGQRTYGLWLAYGELLAYLALADLGVFAVLPWFVAGADGRGDRSAIRRLLVNGILVGAIVGAVILVGGAALWIGAVRWLDLTPVDRAALGGPLLLLAVGAALSYPLRVFGTVLGGLQDVTFCGLLTVSQSVLSILLTVTLLLAGVEAYALAVAATVPVVVGSIVGAWRTARVAPDLLSGWAWPTPAEIGRLLKESIGGWLGGFGVHLLAASTGLVLLALGQPELVPVYVCTAKVGQILQHMCWTLPDSSLVGLSQLYGEGRRERSREVVTTILDLHLLLIGSAVCGVLAFNPTFVRLWVGPELYGGDHLNLWLSAGFIVSTLVHAVVTPVAVVGHRLQVGIAAILNGFVSIGLSLWLGSVIGLVGLVIAFVVSSLAINFVWGILLLQQVFALGPAEIWTGHLRPWLLRVGPALALAGFTGPYLAEIPVWAAVAVVAASGVVYIWWTRPLLDRLPLPVRLRDRLERLGLVRPQIALLNPRQTIPHSGALTLVATGDDARTRSDF